MIYITSYEVIGSNCTGTYAVNAKSKSAANKIVRAFDEDYVRVSSTTKEDWDQEEWDDMMEEITVENDGDYVHIESGT